MNGSTARELPALLICLVLCFGAAGIGGTFTTSGLGEWYDSLKKPSWNPPAWVFGPVWTVLYALMGTSLWLVWRRRATHEVQFAVVLFVAHLLLNVGWSAIFFGLRKPGWAFVEIVVLWASIIAVIRTFSPVDRLASLLLVPYVAWVTFAVLLNGSLWILNR